MKKMDIGAVIICDNVRQEINGKQILIGVYASDIIVNSKNSILPLSIWVEYTPDKAGDDSVHFRILYNARPVAGVQVNMHVKEAGKINGIATPAMPIQIHEPGQLAIEVSADGKQWMEVKTKAVRIAPVTGAVPLSFASPQSR